MEEVRELFLNQSAVHFVEKGQRKDENVYSANGQTDAGRYLLCYFIRNDNNRALVVSATDMTDIERKRHGRK